MRREVGGDLCDFLEIGAGREERLQHMVYYSIENKPREFGLEETKERRGSEVSLPVSLTTMNTMNPFFFFLSFFKLFFFVFGMQKPS